MKKDRSEVGFTKSCTGIDAEGRLFHVECGKEALPAGFMASGTPAWDEQ